MSKNITLGILYSGQLETQLVKSAKKIGGIRTIILTDDKQSAIDLKRLSYDGRHPDIPWREQDIDMIGYHYYMNPEIAQIGLDKFDKAVDTPPREWKYEDWPDLTTMKIFK